MNYCRKCVQPDTRPGIVFQDGVCGACLYEEKKEEIDWLDRKWQLEEIAGWAIGEAYMRGSNYDCAIGVSGGKDSTLQALYARDELNLQCLLVNSEPEGITPIGRKNIENLKNLGFDVISIRPNPKVMKQCIKRDFYEYLNPVKVTEFSLWASTYIIADKFNIPLIIQGENPAFTLGVQGILDSDDDALKTFSQDTLKTGWYRYCRDGIDERDMFLFHFDLDSVRKKNIKGVWLQYYYKDWTPRKNAEFSQQNGLTVRCFNEWFGPSDIGTYVNFAQLDNDLTPLNQVFKYYKFGFGQCTDYACHDIRDRYITREEGIELVEKYDGKVGDFYIKKFCDYMGITQDEMWLTVDRFVNKDLFEKKGNVWTKKFSIGH